MFCPETPRTAQVLQTFERTVSCELVNYFIFSWPSKSRDPIQSHYVPGRDIQCLLSMSYHDIILYKIVISVNEILAI